MKFHGNVAGIALMLIGSYIAIWGGSPIFGGVLSGLGIWIGLTIEDVEFFPDEDGSDEH